MKELRTLAAVATSHFKRGARELEAWGRASADFPELLCGRELVSLFLGFTESTCEVERSLKEVGLQTLRERSGLLDTSLESLLVANQAPHDFVYKKKNAAGDVVLEPRGRYLPDLLKKYRDQFGYKLARGDRKTRRDAGVAKDPEVLKAERKRRGQPKPEAVPQLKL